MNWKEKARDFLFWWSKEFRGNMNILGECEVIMKDMNYFENLDFHKWLHDNNLMMEYEDFLADCNE